MNVQRKYQVIAGSNPAREVFPINDSKVGFSQSKPDDDKVFYERKLKTALKFSNKPKEGITDFDYFYGFESDSTLKCTEFKIQIFKLCGGVFILDWEGIFSLTDGDWDLDQCTFSVKPERNDKYLCLKKNKNQEVNILDVPTIITTTTNLDFNYEFAYCVGFTSACSPAGFGWTLFYQNLNYQYVKDCVTYTINVKVYYREAIVTACIGSSPNPPPGSGWILQTNNCGTSSTSKYVRVPVAGTTPYTSNVIMGWYDFITGQEKLSPYPKTVSVNSTLTPASEDIMFQPTTNNTIYVHSSSPWYKWIFSVLNNPNSTYVWSYDISSTVLMTVTGSGNSCIITPVSNSTGILVVKLTETHGNGHVSIKLFSFNVVTIPLGTNFNSMPGYSRTETCKDNIDIHYCSQPPYLTTPGVCTWTVIGNGTIIGPSTGNSVTVKAGSSGSYTVSASWTLTEGINTITSSYTAIVNIVVMPSITPDFWYIKEVYPTENTDLVNPFNITNDWRWWYGSTVIGTGTNVGYLNTQPWIAPSVGTYCVENRENGVDCSCAAWTKIVPAVSNGTVGFFPPVYWCNGNSLSSSITYNRNRSFKEVVEYVIDQLGCGITDVVSDFFDWNAVGDATGYSPGINYVTGAANKLTNITIAQKSDIINYLSSNKATKGMITLDKLEKIWAWMFNAYWFVDQFGRFRIEHISFFNRTVAYDANALPHKPYNVAKNKWTYSKSKMPKYEVFKCSEMLWTDFIGASIWYDSICVDQESSTNQKERFLDYVTTDLYALYIDPANANKVGFVLMANDKVGTTYSVAMEAGGITGNLIANGHLAWANLHPAYHKHNRVLKQGNMNLAPTIFLTVKPTKQQKDVVFNICCNDIFDPLTQLYKTQIGNGILEEAEETEHGIIKTTLNHE